MKFGARAAISPQTANETAKAVVERNNARPDPGLESAETLCVASFIKIFLLVFVAFSAFKLFADAGVAAFFGLSPFAERQRRVVSNVLIVAAAELGTPMLLIVLIETCYPLSHRNRRLRCSRDFGSVGFHQRNIVNAITQQTPDATTSGMSCLKCPASAASIVAERIQSCAMFIITSKARRACQMAERPSNRRPFRDPFSLSWCMALSDLSTNRPNFSVFAGLDRYHTKRPGRRTVKDIS